MDCHGRGKGNEKAILDSGESSGAAGGLSKTYVVTKEGKRIELKGTIKDPWSHGTKGGGFETWGTNSFVSKINKKKDANSQEHY
ncbi:hypothetical protein ZEAMMB73_Zm00001d035182 [Zea mays]|uniref:Uncharacterized protein n=1 Tax=Zea mays TaxID=4577 RepID=A0A1D6LEV7_MAIZE|nr:hypothetical protein ZEAMMB73_Zm00001d035182 [Zea mays]